MKKRNIIHFLYVPLLSSLLLIVSCNQQPQPAQQKAEPPAYEKIGMDYALATKAVLGKNLITAMSTQGVEQAIGFCNEKAYPLTDSMATALQAGIKRVSDKNRNAGNAASAEEQAYIESCRQQLARGEQLKPQLQHVNGKIRAYYPIMTEKLCLQCHGMPETDVLPATMQKIRSLYPNDKATGYKENEIRGIWVVEMAKK